jgi:hypothetical protein
LGLLDGTERNAAQRSGFECHHGRLVMTVGDRIEAEQIARVMEGDDLFQAVGIVEIGLRGARTQDVQELQRLALLEDMGVALQGCRTAQPRSFFTSASHGKTVGHAGTRPLALTAGHRELRKIENIAAHLRSPNL